VETVIVHTISGTAAGIVAAFASTPFDVVKTRMQVEQKLAGGERKYTSVWSTVKVMIKQEGAKAFVRGLYPRLIMITPVSACTFVAYEQIKRWSRKESSEP
jgi:solute carrier family 25 aspartate/glutamate transporter 12/13